MHKHHMYIKKKSENIFILLLMSQTKTNWMKFCIITKAGDIYSFSSAPLLRKKQMRVT